MLIKDAGTLKDVIPTTHKFFLYRCIDSVYSITKWGWRKASHKLRKAVVAYVAIQAISRTVGIEFALSNTLQITYLGLKNGIIWFVSSLEAPASDVMNSIDRLLIYIKESIIS